MIQHPVRAPAQQPRQPTPRKRNWTPWLVIGGVLTFGFLMLAGTVSLVMAVYLTADRIPAGVSVAGLPLGGQMPESATKTLSALASRPVKLVDGERYWELKLADLGISIDTKATLAQAERAAPNTDVSPFYNIDLNQAQAGLIYISDLANIPATTDSPGRMMEIPVTLSRLHLDVTGELADGLLELDMIAVEPPTPEADAPYTGATTTHVVERGQELALIAREYGVSTDDIVRMNGITNPDLIYVGQELIVPSAGHYTPENVPAAPTPAGKSIVVSTGDQRIYAYENGQLVRSHLVSTGRSATPTVLGDYKIYVKYQADDMSGPDYFLPQVPYTMYFYRGYGIHGTYWHNSFGRPMSHGCVNLPTDEANWFFGWAEVGTPVRVI